MKQDIRITKTQRALRQAMLELLEQKTFRAITVHDLCQQALVSRATFYAHFSDKFALLQDTLAELKRELLAQTADDKDELLRRYIDYMYAHKRMFRHLLADEGLLELTQMLDEMLDHDLKNRPDSAAIKPEGEVVIQYAVGGMIQTLKWVIRQNFRPSPDIIADQLLRIRDMFLEEYLG